MNDNPVVKMEGEFLDPDALMHAAMQERYAVPAVVVAALKQSGKKVAIKMMKLIESDRFDKLPIQTQLNIAEFVFDRAFGKAESASVSMALNHKISNNGGNPEHEANGRRIRELEQRVVFPELARTKTARAIAGEVTPSETSGDAGGSPSRVPRATNQNVHSGSAEVVQMPRYVSRNRK